MEQFLDDIARASDIGGAFAGWVRNNNKIIQRVPENQMRGPSSLSLIIPPGGQRFAQSINRGVTVGDRNGILVYNDFFSQPDNRYPRCDARRMDVLTFELGKMLHEAIIGTPEGRNLALLGANPGASMRALQRCASGTCNNLGDIGDSDQASNFGYAVRAAVFNLTPPSGVNNSAWNSFKSQLRGNL